MMVFPANTNTHTHTHTHKIATTTPIGFAGKSRVQQ